MLKIVYTSGESASCANVSSPRPSAYPPIFATLRSYRNRDINIDWSGCMQLPHEPAFRQSFFFLYAYILQRGPIKKLMVVACSSRQSINYVYSYTHIIYVIAQTHNITRLIHLEAATMHHLYTSGLGLGRLLSKSRLLIICR